MAGTKNDTLIGKNADFSQAGGPNATSGEANGLNTDGQMWIGTTALNAGSTHINVGTLTSPDSSVTVGYSSPNVTLVVAGGTTTGKTITGDAGGALSPTAGNWNIFGGTVVAGTSPVATSGAASTLTLNVQRSQALASADSTKVGLSNFNSAQFTVDANGFVSTSGSAIPNTITGDSGGALSPTAGNWNILGGPGVTTSGSGSTLTINSVVYTDQGGSTSVTSDSGSFATGAITLTLPATPAQGELCEFVTTSAAALVVDAPSTHLIRIGTSVSSAGGTATSPALAGSSLVLRYRSSDTTWYATSVIGVWITA